MIAMTTRGEKLAGFIAENGLTYDDLMKMFATDNLCPGICTDVGCKFTCEEIESDQENGYCEKCGNQTVVSVLILAGVT